MSWIILIIGGGFEAAFTFCMSMMRTATGLHWWYWLGGFIACTTVSMGCLIRASQTIPSGTCYPVWTGIGALGAVLIGVIWFHEPATTMRLFFLTMLIASIIGLKLVS